MAVDGGDWRLEEALTDEWRVVVRFERNPVRPGILRSSAVARRWGGVSGEPVRLGKRRENGEKEGDAVAMVTVLNRHAEVVDGRQGGTTWRMRAERGGPVDRAQSITARPRRALFWAGALMRGPQLAAGEGGRAGNASTAADTRAWQHSAARFCFKPIQTESKIF
jgi:hypothetical protein